MKKINVLRHERTLPIARVMIINYLDVYDVYNFLWVVDFPVFANVDGEWHAMHHPFTSPIPEDMDKLANDPGNARALAYDVVLNGCELGGGSIRIHRSDVQEVMFNTLGIDKISLYVFQISN